MPVERDRHTARYTGWRQVAATPPPDSADAQFASVATRPFPERSMTGRPPVAAVDVYVDDFLLIAQTEAQKQQVMRSTLTVLTKCFAR